MAVGSRGTNGNTCSCAAREAHELRGRLRASSTDVSGHEPAREAGSGPGGSVRAATYARLVIRVSSSAVLLSLREDIVVTTFEHEVVVLDLVTKLVYSLNLGGWAIAGQFEVGARTANVVARAILGHVVAPPRVVWRGCGGRHSSSRPVATRLARTTRRPRHLLRTGVYVGPVSRSPRRRVAIASRGRRRPC